MKIDKEYPATHSMNTSWFGIDKDGYVAIFDFEDDGPVPSGCAETLLEEVIFYHLVTFTPNGERSMNYTIEQAEELIKLLYAPTIEEFWYDTIVRVKLEDREIFKNFFRKQRKDGSWDQTYVIINEDLGLYYADFSGKSDGEIQQIYDSGVVIGICHVNFDLEYMYEQPDPEWKLILTLDGFPFYLFEQYYPENNMKLSYTPKFPMRVNQLDEKIKLNALRFPFSFKEQTEFQIAFYAQSEKWSDDGSFYEGLRKVRINKYSLPDGGVIRTRQSVIGSLNCNKCGLCGNNGFGFMTLQVKQYGLEPTIIVLYAFDDDTLKQFSKIFSQRSISSKVLEIPVIPGLPKTIRSYEFFRDRLKDCTIEDFLYSFGMCHDKFEQGISEVQPRVILATDRANEILRKYYRFSGNIIKIGSEDYPYFTNVDYEKNLEQIIELSNLPYQGILPERLEYIGPEGKSEE